MPHVYVSMSRDDTGWPPVEAEELDAVPAGPGLFRVAGIPVFARGLAVGDVVRVVRVHGEDERLWVSELVEDADHWTVRLLPGPGGDPAAIAAEVGARGHLARTTAYRIVCVDLAPGPSRDEDFAGLVAGARDGRWELELACGGPAA